ncbi:MAG: aspartate aminotransferase family protein [Rikenellaceae bacterium]|nr:aspartate aminotransferase family protein [Rikenellaceae bacterium]
MKLFDVYSQHDIAIVKGNGMYVWDDKGQQYLDMYGGHAVISIGHSHPSYVMRIADQVATLGFYSNAVKLPGQQELADKLGALSGHEDYQLFLCNSGAEANENAMKLASFVTGRSKIVALRKAFHGRTSLAVSATDNPKIQAPVNKTDNVLFTPINDVEALRALFAAEGANIAGVIFEKIQGVGGIIVAEDDFCREAKRLCEEYGALYIADEVQAGCGRTGHYYATDRAGFSADMYTMAKGIANGFPVGAVAIAPHIEAKKGMLGTTFGGNPLSCAAAIAVADVMSAEGLVANAAEMGELLMAELRKLDGIKELRGEGLMIGIEFESDCSEIKRRLLFDHHVFVGSAGTNVVRLLPPLCLGRQQVEEFIAAFRSAING